MAKLINSNVILYGYGTKAIRIHKTKKTIKKSLEPIHFDLLT